MYIHTRAEIDMFFTRIMFNRTDLFSKKGPTRTNGCRYFCRLNGSYTSRGLFENLSQANLHVFFSKSHIVILWGQAGYMAS